MKTTDRFNAITKQVDQNRASIEMINKSSRRANPEEMKDAFGRKLLVVETHLKNFKQHLPGSREGIG